MRSLRERLRFSPNLALGVAGWRVERRLLGCSTACISSAGPEPPLRVAYEGQHDSGLKPQDPSGLSLARNWGKTIMWDSNVYVFFCVPVLLGQPELSVRARKKTIRTAPLSLLEARRAKVET